MGILGTGGDGSRTIRWGVVDGGSAGRDDWNWGAFQKQSINLLQWELPEIHQGDPSEDS